MWGLASGLELQTSKGNPSPYESEMEVKSLQSILFISEGKVPCACPENNPIFILLISWFVNESDILFSLLQTNLKDSWTEMEGDIVIFTYLSWYFFLFCFHVTFYSNVSLIAFLFPPKNIKLYSVRNRFKDTGWMDWNVRGAYSPTEYNVNTSTSQRR